MIKVKDSGKAKIKDSIVQLNKMIETLNPKLAKIMLTTNLYGFDVSLMDAYYKSWVQQEQKGKHVKFRHISAVINNDLKDIHNFISTYLPLTCNDNVFSYKKNTSILDCATPHLNKFALFKLDVTDYFPSITMELIYLKYVEAITNTLKSDRTRKVQVSTTEVEYLSKIIAILCTRSDTKHTDNTSSILPIGISTAASISNGVFNEIDDSVDKIAAKYSLVYTRYSDNLFISTLGKDHIDRDIQAELIHTVNSYTVNGKQPFVIKNEKTRYAPRWRHQRILGVVVNTGKPNISRIKEAWLRSALNHLYYDTLLIYSKIDKAAFMTKHQISFNKSKFRSREVFGYLSFVSMVNRAKFEKYSSQYHIIKVMLTEIELKLSTK